MRASWLALFFIACATSGPARPTTPAGTPGEPEIVHLGKTFKLGFAEAESRYSKGARCGGSDAPESQIGAPDQRNEMQMGRDLVITYGFRFPEGTLMIRCRANRVEVVRTLK